MIITKENYQSKVEELRVLLKQAKDLTFQLNEYKNFNAHLPYYTVHSKLSETLIILNTGVK